MKRVIDIVLLLFFLISSFLFYFFEDLELEKLSSFPLYVITFFLPPSLLVMLILRLRIKVKWIQKYAFWIFSLPILFIIIFSGRRHSQKRVEYIKENGGIVIIGIVTNKEINMSSGYLDLQTDCNNLHFSQSKNFVEDVNIGDTMLILKSLIRNDRRFIYRKNPTNHEIERCKEGWYYLNGEMVDDFHIRQRVRGVN